MLQPASQPRQPQWHHHQRRPEEGGRANGNCRERESDSDLPEKAKAGLCESRLSAAPSGGRGKFTQPGLHFFLHACTRTRILRQREREGKKGDRKEMKRKEWQCSGRLEWMGQAFFGPVFSGPMAPIHGGGGMPAGCRGHDHDPRCKLRVLSSARNKLRSRSRRRRGSHSPPLFTEDSGNDAIHSKLNGPSGQ